jgi:hypothetical protein
MHLHLIIMHLVVLFVTCKTLGEVVENQVFRIVFLEVLGEVVLSESLFDYIADQLFVGGDVFVSDESITITPFTLMDPQLD